MNSPIDYLPRNYGPIFKTALMYSAIAVVAAGITIGALVVAFGDDSNDVSSINNYNSHALSGAPNHAPNTYGLERLVSGK